MNSIAGFGSTHTMKVRGSMGGKEAIFLIDSGATHNFVAEDLCTKLKLPTKEVAEYSVTVGDGYSVKQKQRCTNLPFQIQGLSATQTFYPFPLRGVDAVLGMEWLKSLGEVKVNWNQLTMKFGKKPCLCAYKGIPLWPRPKSHTSLSYGQRAKLRSCF